MFDFGNLGLINIYYSLVGYLVKIALVFQVLFKFIVEAFIQSYYEIMREKLSKIKHCVGKMAMLVTNGRNCHWSPIFQGNPQMCTICNRLIQKGR